MFTGGQRESFKAASNNVVEIFDVLSHSPIPKKSSIIANIEATLSGNSRAMAEKLPEMNGHCHWLWSGIEENVVPVRNIEFPQASKIRMTNARPRKTFPFLRRPRHPYPIRISPTAPIPTFKVLWKVLKYAKLSEYHSNSENTHPETIFHYAKAPVWLLWLTSFVLSVLSSSGSGSNIKHQN